MNCFIFWDKLQVLKRINYIFVILALTGCTTVSPRDRAVNILEQPQISESNFGEATNFRVGMLLPLTGKASKQGEGLRNAALMALEDVNNPNILLQFFDTKSTASGARIAVENALNQKSQLIIGPLMAEEVKAISEKARNKNVPIIAFSTNNDVLQKGVYSLGLLVDEQVDRIVTYAAKKGKKDFALLVPDNNTGIAVSKAAVLSAQNNGVNIVSITFYTPDTSDFSEVIKGMTNYEKRSERVKKIKTSLTAKAEKGDENAAKILARLKPIDTLGDVEFDAVIIPEHGTRLKSAVAMLGYYDVSAPKVKIMGTSVWESSKLNNESNLIGGWYPALSRSHSTYFANKYSQIFKETPNCIYSFAYDAVALASAIAKGRQDEIEKAITNPDGYIGINGAFRIFGDGTNQHSLDIIEVKRSGDEVIEPAPKKFNVDNYMESNEIIVTSDYISPKIYGKDPYLVQSQIYGYQLSPDNQPSYDAEEDEGEIVRKSLAKHKIVIP